MQEDCSSKEGEGSKVISFLLIGQLRNIIVFFTSSGLHVALKSHFCGPQKHPHEPKLLKTDSSHPHS